MPSPQHLEFVIAFKRKVCPVTSSCGHFLDESSPFHLPCKWWPWEFWPHPGPGPPVFTGLEVCSSWTQDSGCATQL